MIPPLLARALASVEGWFVIGGNAVRCFVPYRPSHVVDLGVCTPAELDAILDALREQGTVDVVETADA